MAFASPVEIPTMVSQSLPTASPPESQSKWDYMTNRRSRKQASMFFLGATLFTFSMLLTRRSTFYRRQMTYPLFYKPSNVASAPVNGPLEAVKALQLATFNVIGFMTMVVGGGFWAFDISGIDDLRSRLKSVAPRGWEKVDAKVDEEFEEWLAVTLARRKAKEEASAKGK